MKKFFLPFVFIMVATLLFTGCGDSDTTTPTTSESTTATSTTPSSTTTTGPKYGGTLRYIYDVSPASIPGWPYDQTDNQRRWANWVCFEPLVRRDASGEPNPYLATSWEWGPDKMTLTFELREDVQFHDGTPFDATAVELLGNLLIAEGSSTATYWEKWEIIDSMTVKLTLKTYNSNIWGSIHDFHQVSPTVLEQGIAYAHENPCGTGPFKFLDFQKDVYLKFTKNDNYWQAGRPYLDEIDFLTVVEGLTQQAKMEAGEADMMGVMQGKILQDLGNEGFNVISLTSGSNFLLFDTTNEGSVTNDPEVRMAIEYATNKQEMVDALGYGFYVANNQILPPNNPGHTQGLGTRDYNPDKARELLADAGLENGFTVDIVVMNTYQDGGIMLEQYYRDVGITVNLIVVESAGYWDYIMGGWEGIIFGGYGLPLDIASFVLNYFPPIASFNVSTEIPDDIRELAEAYITEKDDDRAKEINDEINQMIFDRCLFVTTYSNAVGYVLYPYVKGGGFMEYVDFKPWDPADVWMDK